MRKAKNNQQELTSSNSNTEYKNFPTWEEVLVFEVDGVTVKAIATHKWREELIRIIHPFEVEGNGFRAPLVCLSSAMLGRRQALAARGLTERDDCIRMARSTYLLELARRRARPHIECQTNRAKKIRKAAQVASNSIQSGPIKLISFSKKLGYGAGRKQK